MGSLDAGRALFERRQGGVAVELGEEGREGVSAATAEQLEEVQQVTREQGKVAGGKALYRAQHASSIAANERRRGYEELARAIRSPRS